MINLNTFVNSAYLYHILNDLNTTTTTTTATTTTTNVMDQNAANHIVTGALYKNQDLKLLHS